MRELEVAAGYPWQSEVVYAAEMDGQGRIIRANQALALAAGTAELGGIAFGELIAPEQRQAFDRRLAQLGEGWERANFGFTDQRGFAAVDRTVWLRRIAGRGEVQLFAEPAFDEHHRLVEQVLQLNDDLIASQRSRARRQRDLELAQGEAAASAHRVRQLEAIVLAGLTPADFDDALKVLLRLTQELLPGDRADILLLDRSTSRLVLRATVGAGATIGRDGESVAVGEGVLGRLAQSNSPLLIEDLAASHPEGVPVTEGSLIGTPLRSEGTVIGVLVVTAARPRSYAADDLRLLELVGERVALAIGQAQIRQREQRMAEVLQRTLLPQRLPELPGLRLAARYLPHAADVGGDFYDAVALPDGTLGVAIGDVTGKGLRAAATMSRLRSALHAYALDSRSPAEVLTRLGRLAEVDGAIATAVYLVLDPLSGRVEMASAGHLPPLLLGPGAVGYVDLQPALSPPLGVAVEQRHEVGLDLAPGAGLLLYTDGLVERSRNIDEGMRRFADAAARLAGEPPDELVDGLLRSVLPAGRYRDDVAVLAVRRDPVSEPFSGAGSGSPGIRTAP